MSLAKSPSRFAPPWWAWLLTGAGVSGALLLGSWQLQRAEDKRALLADYLAAQTEAPVPLGAQTPAGARPLAVNATGTYDVQRQLLLDNQSLRERPGYHVWTPLRLEDGSLVLVNRGWVAQFADRAVPPALAAPAGVVELRGLWRALPRAGLATAAPACQAVQRFPHFVVYPQRAELACVLGEPVADGVLLLDPRAEGGFAREWSFAELIPPERHVGYAVQWFAIAVAILILFIKLNLKRHV
jgi:surfeit locus 1 family protein